MRIILALLLLLFALPPASARPVAPGSYTKLEPTKGRPDRIDFHPRMVRFWFAKSNWEVPVARGNGGTLLLERNPNLTPDQGYRERLRYAPGPWPGTAWFALGPGPRKGWNLSYLYVGAAALERWNQLPTADFTNRDDAVKVLREFYTYALTQPDPQSDGNMLTFFLRRGMNPIKSRAALMQQEMALSTDPEVMQILESFFTNARRQ